MDARDIPPCMICGRHTCADRRACDARILRALDPDSRRVEPDVVLIGDDQLHRARVFATAPVLGAISIFLLWVGGQVFVGEPAIPTETIPPAVYAPAPTTPND